MAADRMTAEARPPNIMLSMLSVLSMLPMLRIPEKKTTSVDLFGPLSRDIARKYSKFEDENLRDELQTLNDRRSQLENLAKEPSFTVRLGLLLSYFRALYEIKTLFSFPKDQIYNLTFTWHDAFKPNKKASQKNIDLEEAAVLFNVGAVYSQIGQSKDRSTEEGWREAVQAFRLAAGAFAFLKGYAAAEAAMGKSTTVDMSKECTGMLEKLMLAQAQECWFQIAIDKGITPGECAKVSRQVALYYEEALAALNAALLKGHVYQKWKSYMQLKAAFFNAGACYGLGLKLHEEGKVAEVIARLKRGISILSEAKKPTKGRIHQLWNVSTKIKKISDAIDKLKDKMNGSLTKAEKDMDFHTGVPSPDSLPSLPSRSLVKQPIPINVVLDAVGVLAASNERPFASLVSHGNAIALCGSTEWVDVINIQAHEDKLQQCNEHIRARLEKMDLQYYSLSPEGHLTLPADLKKDVEAIQISGGPAGLQSELQQVQDLGQAILGLVFQTKQHLQTTPQSSTRAKNLQDQLNAIIDNLKQAAETDARIERLVKCHSALMSILDSRPVESAFPDISLDPKEDATVKALKKDLRELETLGAQGEGLQQDLKDMNGEDDIQRKLAASMGSLEDLFEEEISKYDCLCKDIDQNIEARKRLLLKIQAQNDQLSSFPNLEKYKASCQKFYEKFQAAISKYQEIKQEIDQERNFYNTLQKTVTRVKQHCGESMTQNIQYPGTIGFESDVNGQAASNFVAGRDEGAIQKILKMGRETWDRDTVVRALRAASNNPYRALEYLYWGIPEQAEVPPAAQVSPGAQAANPPAQSAPGQLPSAMPQAVTVTPEEREDIEELAGLGFEWAIVRDVYFESNKNKEMTANFLLDMNTTTDSRK